MVGKEIRRIRRENHLSQEEFAEKAGVSRQTVHNWENDLADPSLEKLSELSILFQVPLTSFLSDVPAAAQLPSAENAHNETEQENCETKVSDKSHKKRIILFSAILISVMIISSFILIIFGIAAFPGEEEKSHLTYSVYYIGSFSQFIFWTAFTVAIVIVAVLVFLIVRLVRKGRRPRK